MAQSINNYCSYYQAHVNPQDAWFLVSVLKSFENVAMDRTLDAKESVFEFFVPEATENIFLHIMEFFQQQNIVTNLHKVQNRLVDSDSI